MKYITKYFNDITLSILLIVGIIIFILSIFDILFDQGWILFLAAGYIIIFSLLVIPLFSFYSEKKIPSLSIEEFEKSLSGGLFHFKCPVCDGIFAVKKSKGNDNLVTEMTCPDCGIVGIISDNPDCTIEEIPEKKSPKENFRCRNCGEGVTIWAEGSNLFSDTKILVCPFCKNKKPLEKL